MDFSIETAAWIALIVLLTMWASRTIAGVLITQNSGAAQVIGRALGSIVA